MPVSIAKERGGLVELPHKPGGDFFFIPFLFNPKEYEISDTQTYSKKTIPLWPDPNIQYVGGAGQTFKFTMMLESLRMREIFGERHRRDVANQVGGSYQITSVNHGGAVAETNTITTRTFNNLQSGGQAHSINTEIDFAADLESYIERIDRLSLPHRGGVAGSQYDSAPNAVMAVFGVFWKIGQIEKTKQKLTDFYHDGRLKSVQYEVEMTLIQGGRIGLDGRFRPPST